MGNESSRANVDFLDKQFKSYSEIVKVISNEPSWIEKSKEFLSVGISKKEIIASIEQLIKNRIGHYIISGSLSKKNLVEFERVCFERFKLHSIDKNNAIIGIIDERKKQPMGYCIKLKIFKKSFFSKKKIFCREFSGYFNKKHKREGYGEQYLSSRPDWMIFKGYFVNGIREGKGIEYSDSTPNLSLYEGSYSNGGLRNGRGQFYDEDRQKKVLVDFEDGYLIREVSTTSIVSINYEDIEHLICHENLLGVGPFGVVYKIRANVLTQFGLTTHNRGVDLSEYVAVKIFDKDGLLHPSKTAKKVVKLCRRMNNPHVVSVLGIVKGKKNSGYIMEIFQNSIFRVIQTNSTITPYDWSPVTNTDSTSDNGDENENENNDMLTTMEEKMRILYETSLGMKEMHSCDIVHRDLNWHKIMIDRTDSSTIKVSNFDRATEDHRSWKFDGDEILFTNEDIASPLFRAPEFASGKYDKKIDVFSFGLMVYCLFFNVTNPFYWMRLPQFSSEKCKCGTLLSSIRRFEFESHIRECDIRPRLFHYSNNNNNNNSKKKKFGYISSEYSFLLDLMEKCWAKDPEDRPSFDQIVQILEIRPKYLYSRFKYNLSSSSSSSSSSTVSLINSESLLESTNQKYILDENTKLVTFFLEEEEDEEQQQQQQEKETDERKIISFIFSVLEEKRSDRNYRRHHHRHRRGFLPLLQNKKNVYYVKLETIVRNLKNLKLFGFREKVCEMISKYFYSSENMSIVSVKSIIHFFQQQQQQQEDEDEKQQLLNKNNNNQKKKKKKENNDYILQRQKLIETNEEMEEIFSNEKESKLCPQFIVDLEFVFDEVK